MTDNDLSARGTHRTFSAERATKFDGVELRASDAGNSLTFTGYASVFNRSYSVSDWLGEFNEQVAPGAFRDSLAKGADVPFKLNHEGMTLARTKSGTMNLAEDSHGLHVEARLDPSNPQVQALRSAMERGDLDEMSFAFRTTSDVWDDAWMNRTVTGADIHKGDVSVVNYGANPYTVGAKLRKLDVFKTAWRDMAPAELDPETKEILFHVLQLVSAADANLDVIQPKLACVLGVPNPDLDAASADQVSESYQAEQQNGLHDFYALRLRALSL
jgi:HK97 family phage prohead protease